MQVHGRAQPSLVRVAQSMDRPDERGSVARGVSGRYRHLTIARRVLRDAWLAHGSQHERTARRTPERAAPCGEQGRADERGHARSPRTWGGKPAGRPGPRGARSCDKNELRQKPLALRIRARARTARGACELLISYRSHKCIDSSINPRRGGRRRRLPSLGGPRRPPTPPPYSTPSWTTS